MIVYGKNVFSALQEEPQSVLELYVLSSSRDPKIQAALKNLPGSVCLKTLSRKEMDRICDGGVHNGIAAKIKDIPYASLDEIIEKAKGKGNHALIVALDGIQDPHNVGAILRSCDAAGADGTLICKHNAAGLTPAAVKASTGAALTIPVAQVNSMASALQKLKEEGFWVAGTDFDKESIDYRKGNYDSPIVLVIGNEGKGMSASVKKQCDFKLHLPMRGSVQSLNASVAAGILLYEIQSQRNL